jgi:hypothetical protein
MVKSSPGNFRYGFLDPFRVYSSPSYFLVDEAIDLVSFLSPDITYLSTSEDFSRIATRVVRVGNEKTLQRPVPKRMGIYAPKGPMFWLEQEEREGLREIPQSIAKMRSSAWLKIVEQVVKGTVLLNHFDQTGDCTRWSTRQEMPLRAQRSLIQNCGCMWVPSSVSFVSQIVIPAFNAKALRRAFDPALSEEALAKRKRRVRPAEVLAALESLQAFAVKTDSLVTSELATSCARAALDIDVHQYPDDSFKDLIKSFKEDNGEMGFCGVGKGKKLFGRPGGIEEEFQQKFLLHFYAASAGPEDMD